MLNRHVINDVFRSPWSVVIFRHICVCRLRGVCSTSGFGSSCWDDRETNAVTLLNAHARGFTRTYLFNPIWPGWSSHLVIWFCFAPPSGPGNSWRAMCFPGGTFHRCTTVCLLAFTLVSNKRNNKYGHTRRSRTLSELHTGSWISIFECKYAQTLNVVNYLVFWRVCMILLIRGHYRETLMMCFLVMFGCQV